MLTIGESLNERKAFLWSYIHVCQDLIKAIQQSSIGKSSLAKEVITMEREQIKEVYAELKELQRWFKTAGIEPDEGWKPQSLKDYEAGLTDEQWEERINKAHILDQLREKYRLESEGRNE